MLSFIMTNFDNILGAITSIVAGASALSALTPTAKDDKIWAKIKRILNIFALNIGNAKTV